MLRLNKYLSSTGFCSRRKADEWIAAGKVFVNGVPAAKKGHIFYSNADTYKQAGTYYYDRANWGPGLPINVQYWKIKRPAGGYGTLSLDLNLEKFRSAMSEPNAEGVAQYIIQVNLFGYDK